MLGACVAVAVSLLTHRAVADAAFRLAVDWGKLGVLLNRDDVLPRPSSWQPDPDRATATTSRADRPTLFDGIRGTGGWSLVARDWETARLLMGRLAATDEVKRGRSKRMVLLRGRLAEGPFVPFVQLGLGQWRIDPDILAMPHDAVFAGQVGAGAEFALASWVSIAFEADCTLLNPGRLGAYDPPSTVLIDLRSPPRDARWVRPSQVWGSFLTARARF